MTKQRRIGVSEWIGRGRAAASVNAKGNGRWGWEQSGGRAGGVEWNGCGMRNEEPAGKTQDCELQRGVGPARSGIGAGWNRAENGGPSGGGKEGWSVDDREGMLSVLTK